MKKFFASLLLVMMIAGSSFAADHIGMEKAVDIALADAKIARQDARKIDVELEHGRRGTVYEVEFKSGGWEYEYHIDAVSGEILRSKREWD